MFFDSSSNIIVAMRRSTIFVSYLLGASWALEFTNEPPPHITLPRNTPISIGEVTDVDGKQQKIAWLPTSNICTMSSAVTEFEAFAVGEEDPVAPRIDDLIFAGYNSVKASITRSGKAFARCRVTPSSTKVGTCDGGESVWRTWTCFVDESDEAQKGLDEEGKEEEILVPKNVAEPPPEFAGQGGTYQKWFCDEKGCRPNNE